MGQPLTSEEIQFLQVLGGRFCGMITWHKAPRGGRESFVDVEVGGPHKTETDGRYYVAKEFPLPALFSMSRRGWLYDGAINSAELRTFWVRDKAYDEMRINHANRS